MAQITSGISSGCGKGAPGIEPGPSPHCTHERTRGKYLRKELRPMRPVIRLAAITRLGRLPAAIAARFACGMCAGWKEADGRFRLVSQQKSNLQEFYGSDGTRTRDLRRDGSAPWFAVGSRRSPLVARCAGFPVPALPAFTTGCRRCVPRTFHDGCARASVCGPRFMWAGSSLRAVAVGKQIPGRPALSCHFHPSAAAVKPTSPDRVPMGRLSARSRA